MTPDAAHRASATESGPGKASRARVSTRRAKVPASRPDRISRRAASPLGSGISPRACSGVHSSYSSNRLETSVSSHSESGGERDSDRRYASATDVLEIDQRSRRCSSSFLEHLVQRGDRHPAAAGGPEPAMRRRGQLHAGPHRVCARNASGKNRTPGLPERPELRHHPVTVGNQDRFAGRREPDVLAQPAVQHLEVRPISCAIR